VQDLAYSRVGSVRSKTVRLVRADAVDAACSKQVILVAETPAAFKIKSAVGLQQRDHVMRVVFGPPWHVRMTGLAIVLLVFVDVPNGQAALALA
jgi:hypothetical protein